MSDLNVKNDKRTSTKQQLLNMGLNVFGLDLFVESYNKAVFNMLKNIPDFPKDKLNLSFTFLCRKQDERTGDCEITVTIKQKNE